MIKVKKRNVALALLLSLIIAGGLFPQNFTMPVVGATRSSYHPQSYWYYPWGKSVTHKGVDIFANTGTPVVSATEGVVLYRGEIERGGRVVLILGPKWRLHYYAHLNTIDTNAFTRVYPGSALGTVGTTGNAQGKSPHLHYSIMTLIPHIWRIDGARQGWKKMFYLNPIDYLQ